MKKHTFLTNILFVASALTVTFTAHAAVSVRTFSAPDQNQPGCAHTPTDLLTMPETNAVLNMFGGVQGLTGTWKLTGIPFVKQTISVKILGNGFFLQTAPDVYHQASVCAFTSAKGEKMLRVSVHEPRCPENKNVYVRFSGPEALSLTAYATRTVGSVKFVRKSNQPLPEGTLQPAEGCAKDDAAVASGKSEQ